MDSSEQTFFELGSSTGDSAKPVTATSLDPSIVVSAASLRASAIVGRWLAAENPRPDEHLVGGTRLVGCRGEDVTLQLACGPFDCAGIQHWNLAVTIPDKQLKKERGTVMIGVRWSAPDGLIGVDGTVLALPSHLPESGECSGLVDWPLNSSIPGASLELGTAVEIFDLYTVVGRRGNWLLLDRDGLHRFAHAGECSIRGLHAKVLRERATAIGRSVLAHSFAVKEMALALREVLAEMAALSLAGQLSLVECQKLSDLVNSLPGETREPAQAALEARLNFIFEVAGRRFDALFEGDRHNPGFEIFENVPGARRIQHIPFAEVLTDQARRAEAMAERVEQPEPQVPSKSLRSHEPYGGYKRASLRLVDDFAAALESHSELKSVPNLVDAISNLRTVATAKRVIPTALEGAYARLREAIGAASRQPLAILEGVFGGVRLGPAEMAEARRQLSLLAVLGVHLIEVRHHCFSDLSHLLDSSIAVTEVTPGGWIALVDSSGHGLVSETGFRSMIGCAGVFDSAVHRAQERFAEFQREYRSKRVLDFKYTDEQRRQLAASTREMIDPEYSRLDDYNDRAHLVDAAALAERIGEGTKAALAAFDWLERKPTDASDLFQIYFRLSVVGWVGANYAMDISGEHWVIARGRERVERELTRLIAQEYQLRLKFADGSIFLRRTAGEVRIGKISGPPFSLPDLIRAGLAAAVQMDGGKGDEAARVAVCEVLPQLGRPAVDFAAEEELFEGPEGGNPEDHEDREDGSAEEPESMLLLES